MVSGADKIMFTAGREPFVKKVSTEYGQPAKQVERTGANYAQFDGKAQPNYAKYDTYKSPVTTGVAGDRFDMMM